jgi:1,2-beta-oligoglucan phosphorylase
LGDISIAEISSAKMAEPRHIQLADESAFQTFAIAQPNGITLKALPNGSIYSIEHQAILINQILGSPLAGGIHRIFLRIFDADAIHSTEIVGPGAASEFSADSDRFLWTGSWHGLDYRCCCWLPPGDQSAWVFQVVVDNRSGKAIKADAVLLQDLGLATRGQVRSNERFTAQYLDHFAFQHAEFGHLLITRQNLPQEEDRHPWLIQGCFPSAVGFCTDGFDFFGTTYKANSPAQSLSLETIGQRVRQYEAAYSAIQSSPAQINAGSSQAWSFFSRFSPDHPQESSARDADDSSLQSLLENCRNSQVFRADPLLRRPPLRARSFFQEAPLFDAADLGEDDIQTLFHGPFRHEEFADSRRHSFFYGHDSRHVVFKSKELALARPHGHIMRSGQGLMPDAEVMSCTFYAAGVFASQMTLGNTVFGKFLSSPRDPLNIIRSSGLRIFVRRNPDAPWELLAVPSAFEMAPNFCRWHYKFDRDLLTVTCTASDEDAAFVYAVTTHHHPVELLISGEIAAGPQEYDSVPVLSLDPRRARIGIRPDRNSLLAQQQPEIGFHVVSSTPHAIESLGGDDLLAPSGRPPTLPYFAVRTHPTMHFSLCFAGTFDNACRSEALCAKYESLGVNGSFDALKPSPFWSEVAGRLQISSPSPKASQIHDAMVWMARDAIVHLSVPRGLEQANGGAWGVRDVCQGAVEFLLAQDRPDVVKGILEELFSRQYRQRGDWPQWFMFAPFQQIQSNTSHGDVVIWPLKALCDYLEHSDDGGFLRQELPYTDEETFERVGPSETILKHADRLIERIRQMCLPGLALLRYGEGDWDDSLQPASKDLAENMVSSWTVELLYQTLRRYSAALEHFGESERAESIAGFAADVHADFQRFLIADGVVAGFAVFGSQPPVVDHYILHPRDHKTGLRYRLISMTRGILSGIFTDEQAHTHLDLVKKHLLYPDGARLLDRPTTYRGGRETIFRRSESAAFFGREIGLQYVHAHLRYAEVLAVMGQADELLHALSVANPISVTEAVSNARPRQRNCYFSSSDAAFSDRYQASRDYQKLREGKIAVDGGWRIYSSGPGIFTNLVVRHLFGMRKFFGYMDFDPVLPAEMDGTCCEMHLGGRKLRYQFRRARGPGFAKRVSINGTELSPISIARGQYRSGGIRIKAHEFESALNLQQNEIEIEF